MKAYRKWIAVLLAGVLALLAGGTNLNTLATPFMSLRLGPDFLATNRDTVTDGTEEELLPGAVWCDTDGNPIQAHGGQVQWMPVPDGSGGTTGQYVWVGENKSGGHTGNPAAVYTSDDLYHWTFRGNVLRPVESREQLDSDPYFSALYAGCTAEEKDGIFRCISTSSVIERPKMLYNASTGQYVIWFHSDGPTEQNAYSYDVGMAGVAVSDSPFGPFRFLGRQRLSLCPSDQIDCYPTSRGEARDMNLFQDVDGTAYIVYTSENNKTLYISRLNDSYTALAVDPEQAVYGRDYIRLFPGAMREAPVLVRSEAGRYYLMSSSTTGWMSNQARVWSADSIFGEWRNDGNPCQGQGAAVTFDSQSTCLFRTREGQWIYYGDRWNGGNLADSRYVWLPAAFEDGRLVIRWASAWTPGTK